MMYYIACLDKDVEHFHFSKNIITKIPLYTIDRVKKGQTPCPESVKLFGRR